MKDFFDSSVTKRVASLFSTLYLGLVAVLAYMSLFYDIRILDKPMFLGFIVVFSLLIETIMIYSRKQFYTCFVSILMASHHTSDSSCRINVLYKRHKGRT